jgi:hypothetical protein
MAPNLDKPMRIVPVDDTPGSVARGSTARS